MRITSAEMMPGKTLISVNMIHVPKNILVEDTRLCKKVSASKSLARFIIPNNAPVHNEPINMATIVTSAPKLSLSS